MYPFVSPKRCMCNVSTGHAKGPSQLAPVFSQAITFPQSSHYANIKQCTCSIGQSCLELRSYHLRFILGFYAPTWISHSYGTDEQ